MKRELGATQIRLNLVTRDDEEKLWSSGVLSVTTPKGLLNAVFFLNGKNFALRGGNEQLCLKLSQISRNISPEGKVRFTYTKLFEELSGEIQPG